MRRNLLWLGLLAMMLMLAGNDFSDRAATRFWPEAAANSFAPGRLQVYVLEVGRGESVLLISPIGKAALIDAGPPEAGARVVGELRRRNVQNLEVAVATQTGADYIGGMRRVAGSSDIFIKNFVDSAQPWNSELHQQVLAPVKSAGVPLLAARRGQSFDLGGGARLDVLNPAGNGKWIEPAGAESASREGLNSVVVRVLYGDFAMLIMSGAGSVTAEQLIVAGQNIWAPVLLVGEQGARESVSEKMLSIVQPRFAIISTGTNLPPAPETIERLKAAKAEIYRTDTGGEIYITSDGKKHEVTAERK